MTRTHWQKWIIAVLVLVLGAAAFGAWRARQDPPEKARYRTVAVDTGDIVRSVSANGTLNPVTLVNVGTQVSGTVKKLYADFNDRVKAGQVLAELDPSLFEAQLEQDEGNLADARAKLKLAQANERRTRVLHAHDYVAQADLDAAVQATASAQAAVQTAQGQVARDRTNLGYTKIRSPVSGVVVSRQVDVGQTVAASFQTPVLFQIAENLKRMQIDTSMAEADVGGVRVGQAVSFTVDAYPDRTFKGVVRQVRLNPTVQENVVTYDAVVNVDNPDEILLPGMTAYVTIVVERRDHVLRVPNAALAFHPAGTPEKARVGRATGTVYRLENGRPTPVTVRTGVSDTRYTQIVSGPLKAGEQVVVEDLRPTAKPENGDQRMRFRVF